MTENSFLAFAQRIRIRLFLEGQEVPVISASIHAAPNGGMMCSLQMPPLSEGTELLPRTLVHLFFLDAYEASNPFVLDSSKRTAAQGTDASATDPLSTPRDAIEGATAIQAVPCGATSVPAWSNRRYKLCFGGELAGFQWSKSPMNRSLVLQCVDWSNYWDYAYQWGNTGLFGPGMKAVFSGGATNLFTDFLTSKGSKIAAIVSSGRCNTFPKMQGLPAGIVRLIESIGGSYYTQATDSKGNALRRFCGQNAFFSMAELRLHITQMVAAVESDTTAQRLLRRDGFGGLFNRVLGGLGEQVSIRAAINAVMRVMFHEIYPQPCPLFVHGTGTDAQGTRRVKIASSPELAPFAQLAADTLSGLKSIETKLIEYSESPELQLKAFSSGIRTIMIGISKSLGDNRKQLQQAIPLLRAAKAPEILKTLYSMASRSLQQAQVLAPAWRPKAKSNSRFDKALQEAIRHLQRIPDLTINTLNLKQTAPPRIVQHVLRPDIWFGSPPRCNVLFPDMYYTMAYSRSFFAEPTRFLLQTNDEFFGPNELFDKYYFSPRTGSTVSDQARMQDVRRGALLDHEVFTGILPVFEKMGEFNVFAARGAEGTKGQVPKVGFAERTANFLYFKHRFNSRQLQISGRFNPYVAVGFPGLIIDKWVDKGVSEKIQQMRDQFLAADPAGRAAMLPKYTVELMGTNFLCNFTEVTHQLSQDSMEGVTTINCGYARQVNESTELLGLSDLTQVIKKRGDGEARRVTDVAALSAPELYSIGPNQGRIINVVDVTTKYVRGGDDDELSEGTWLPVYFGGARRGGGTKAKSFTVPVGVPMSPSDMGPEYGNQLIEMMGSDRDIQFNAYAIEEEIPRYRLEEVDVPAEEILRPGWYGSVWGSARIGEAYQSFLGTGAITESTAILDSGGRTVGAANEEFKQAIESADPERGEAAVASAPIVTSLATNSSIQQASEFLTLTYSYVKQADMDADEFIRAYTWRPIATLPDMFGSENLEFNENGTEVISEGSVEGFHSRAFGPYDNAFGLVSPEIEDILGFSRGSVTAQRLDTRKRRYEKVQRFVQALTFGRARVG